MSVLTIHENINGVRFSSVNATRGDREYRIDGKPVSRKDWELAKSMARRQPGSLLDHAMVSLTDPRREP